jgi:transcriptional regulator with GAF, ATPase, and Fis domain
MSDEDVPQSRSFDALTWSVVTDDANLQQALRRVAETGCGLLTNCTSASVTILDGDRAITVGSTDETAQALDDAQYAAREGPCLSAAREGRFVRIEDTSSDERWPKFAASARKHGVKSSLSVPLTLAGEATYGGFNVYGEVAGGFSDDDEALCRTFAGQASIVVANAQAYWAMFESSRNLSTAMQTRAVIEQAKGVLIASNRIGAGDAFELLRRRSMSANRKLRDVAADTVNEAQGDNDAAPHA